MEQSLLSQSVWLSLPLETRAKLANLFSFSEKGSVQTMYGPNGPVVISDGYNYDHLKLITLEKLQKRMGSQSDNFYDLFNHLVEVIDNFDSVTVYSKPAEDTVPIVTSAPKKRGRPAKTV